ncbi:ribbon-helix-helix protein, CopG family [Siculibacillus lacustris]|uniref:Ribbon-helix-helix protein, CopG family n=1 Tax=Siculibacillus lacustris TaxID=1549641 RepID=A0A4Q9VF54_9HYPH|nr:type II toxin-antitoxin system HicB family antitoxin [Siculibacillus lacustris]TBW33372.1 ribbon-helix-helix protein, CopG family [Siculibacillus lacustris]
MAQAYALIHEADGAFGISFPDFPGCVAGGDSVEDVLIRGRATLAFHVAGMVEDGAPMPLLRSHAGLRADPDFVADAEGATLVLIPVDLPTRAVRVNVSIDETLLDQIDRAAQARGETRSGFLAAAARARVAG